MKFSVSDTSIISAHSGELTAALRLLSKGGRPRGAPSWLNLEPINEPSVDATKYSPVRDQRACFLENFYREPRSCNRCNRHRNVRGIAQWMVRGCEPALEVNGRHRQLQCRTGQAERRDTTDDRQHRANDPANRPSTPSLINPDNQHGHEGNQQIGHGAADAGLGTKEIGQHDSQHGKRCDRLHKISPVTSGMRKNSRAAMRTAATMAAVRPRILVLSHVSAFNHNA